MFKKLKLKVIAKYLERERKKLVRLIPTHLQSQFEKESYIAGGSIWSLYNWKKVNDIDVFIESEELKKLLLTYFKELDDAHMKLEYGEIIYIGKYKGERLVVTSNAITIGKYQIIVKDIGTPKEVLKEFDFKHNMHWCKDGEVFTAEDAFNLELTQLIFNDSRARNICGVMMRIPKFIDKGFTINKNEMRKIILRVNEEGFDTDEIKILKAKKGNIGFGSGD